MDILGQAYIAIAVAITTAIPGFIAIAWKWRGSIEESKALEREAKLMERQEPVFEYESIKEPSKNCVYCACSGDYNKNGYCKNCGAPVEMVVAKVRKLGIVKKEEPTLMYHYSHTIPFKSLTASSNAWVDVGASGGGAGGSNNMNTTYGGGGGNGFAVTGTNF